MSKINDIFNEIGHALVSKKFWVELLIMTFGMFMTGVCVLSSERNRAKMCSIPHPR